MRTVGWLSFAAVLAVATALSAGAYQLAAEAWDGVVGYDSPFLGAGVTPAQAEPPVAQRVVLVVVDGLRDDVSRRMGTLRTLRDYGADFRLSAPQPTLSYPNWTTILSGTTPDIHGVVTNWHEGAAGVETIIDGARRAEVPFVVVGPSDIATLYPGVSAAAGRVFRKWSAEYLTGIYVDQTIRLVEEKNPRLVILLLPDIDEAGHASGGASDRYTEVAARVDRDVRRLVEALQGPTTAFVFVTDHGHTDTGGHGGWEEEVVTVPAILVGSGIAIAEGEGRLEDVAPTIAVLAGLPVPRLATGEVLRSAIATDIARPALRAAEQRVRAVNAIARIIREPIGADLAELPRDARGAEVRAYLEAASRDRLAFDRASRSTGPALALGLGALLAFVFVAAVSWRALIAALVGATAYHLSYNVLFFIVHGDRWSLSSFNTEDAIGAWMDQRLLEAALAGLLAAMVAALVYPLLRRSPKRPRGFYLAGWLTLGPLAVLTAQLTLALQAAWFIWAWGVEPVWTLPDLRWGFKFDLDLVQITALGAAALVAPLISYLVGRYHPRMRAVSADGGSIRRGARASAPQD